MIGEQIATRQDLGLADAYVDGDFDFVDKTNGLLNFLLVRTYLFRDWWMYQLDCLQFCTKTQMSKFEHDFCTRTF